MHVAHLLCCLNRGWGEVPRGSMESQRLPLAWPAELGPVLWPHPKTDRASAHFMFPQHLWAEGKNRPCLSWWPLHVLWACMDLFGAGREGGEQGLGQGLHVSSLPQIVQKMLTYIPVTHTSAEEDATAPFSSSFLCQEGSQTLVSLLAQWGAMGQLGSGPPQPAPQGLLTLPALQESSSNQKGTEKSIPWVCSKLCPSRLCFWNALLDFSRVGRWQDAGGVKQLRKPRWFKQKEYV